MASSLCLHYRLMAHFNRQANHRLLAAYCAFATGAAPCLDDQPRDDLLRLLNRALLGDQIWLARIEGQRADEPPTSLLLHRDAESLIAARDAVDQWLERVTTDLEPRDFQRVIAWQSAGGTARRANLVFVLAQLFDRQTRDRTRIAMALEARGAPVPSLAMIDTMLPVHFQSESSPGHKAVTRAGPGRSAARSLLDWIARRSPRKGTDP